MRIGGSGVCMRYDRFSSGIQRWCFAVVSHYIARPLSSKREKYLDTHTPETGEYVCLLKVNETVNRISEEKYSNVSNEGVCPVHFRLSLERTHHL